MNRIKLLVALLFVVVIGLTIVQAQDYYGDARINQTAHLGGDALYCSAGVGCWVLDQGGNQLWNIEESKIDGMFGEACATNGSVIQDVGVGTYGMMTLEVTCFVGYEKTLELCGFDEWGKNECVEFAPSYIPVGAAEPPIYCQIVFSGDQKRIDKGGGIMGTATPTLYNLYLADKNLIPVTFQAIASQTEPFAGVPFCKLVD